MIAARHGARLFSAIAVLGVVLVFSSCAPTVMPAGPTTTAPRIEAATVVLSDGVGLPLKSWVPTEGRPRAVILALHGFNDYGNAFELPARDWAAHGVATYAYDQRGFGASPVRGLWAGTETLVDDAKTVARLVRTRHPGTPFYLLGESMGGAVLIAASNPHLPPADGVILVAPAVRGRETMGALYRGVLWLGAHLFPWAELTGEGLDIVATDNVEVLRAMQKDPLIIKSTRIDAIWGLVDLMDRALATAPLLGSPSALVVYGTRDEVVPAGPVETFVERLPDEVSVAVYDHGYHMLLRDLRSKPVLDDILAWTKKPGAPLASRADQAGAALFDRVAQ